MLLEGKQPTILFIKEPESTVLHHPQRAIAFKQELQKLHLLTSSKSENNNNKNNATSSTSEKEDSKTTDSNNILTIPSSNSMEINSKTSDEDNNNNNRESPTTSTTPLDSNNNNTNINNNNTNNLNNNTSNQLPLHTLLIGSTTTDIKSYTLGKSRPAGLLLASKPSSHAGNHATLLDFTFIDHFAGGGMESRFGAGGLGGGGAFGQGSNAGNSGSYYYYGYGNGEPSTKVVKMMCKLFNSRIALQPPTEKKEVPLIE